MFDIWILVLLYSLIPDSLIHNINIWLKAVRLGQIVLDTFEIKIHLFIIIHRPWCRHDVVVFHYIRVLLHDYRLVPVLFLCLVFISLALEHVQWMVEYRKYEYVLWHLFKKIITFIIEKGIVKGLTDIHINLNTHIKRLWKSYRDVFFTFRHTWSRVTESAWNDFIWYTNIELFLRA